jgi:NAD(P)-dependent dehydrogenase (short-subunit alcohol dehydrogenase family)
MTMKNNQANPGRLEGRLAIITGVSHTGQVGYALASAFAREGALLAISSRSAERVNARAQELQKEGAQVIAIPADLTTEEGANTLVQETLKAYGRIDILVNLAGGLTKYGPSDELSLADWEFELNNNLRTAFLCTRTVWPIMKKQGGGKILNFSRAGGAQSASPMMLAYIVTQSNLDSMKPSPEELDKKWVSMEQIVEAAIFLVTSASDGITGTTLPVQGMGI